ncbi:MAG: ATP-binding protein [Halanaerobium sp.]|nr:ATP-binding protein [Halanaerobium sp.]
MFQWNKLKWNRLSLRNQIFFLFIFIQILVLLLSYFYFNRHFTNFYYDQVRKNLANEISLILRNGKLNMMQSDQEAFDHWIKDIGQQIDARITIINANGTVLADSSTNPAEMDNHANRPEIAEVMMGSRDGQSIRYSRTLKMDMFYLASPIKKEAQTAGIIRLARSLNDINSQIAENIKNYLFFFTLILILITLLAWKFSSDIISPLKKVTSVAGKIAAGSFQERIQLRQYQNEVGVMARRFNFMADQLEKKIAELSQEKSKAEAILTSMVDGLIAVNSRRKVVMLNPAARELLRIPGDDLIGRDIIEVVRHHRIDGLLHQLFQQKGDISEEITLQREDRKILRCHLTPIYSEKGNIAGAVILFTDITELRRLEQVRKDFVANVSHELRTPLTSIIGYLDTLIESNIDQQETVERFLRIIKDEADRLAILIQDLLELSRLEDGKEQPLLPNEIGPIIDKALAMLGDTAGEKKIELRREVAKGLPLVKMVPEQIEQVLINLIDNGIKYTPSGGKVIVRAFQAGKKVILEVQDNGIGIPPEDQERIFERFYRVDKARSRSLGGTGIGLAIVKHILQGHGSEIELESMPEKGSTFRFSLRIAG